MIHDVTLIIPYNKDRGFLQQAIDSVAGQIPSENILPIYGDVTVGANINTGLNQVKTKYWCAMGEDDLLTPNSIADRYRVIEQGYDFIHGRAVTFWQGNEVPYSMTKEEPTLEDMLTVNRICGGTPMYRTGLGAWDESLTTAEEYDWHLKLLHAGHTIGFCDSVVYKWRRHDLQKSLGNKNRAYQERRQAIIKGIRKRYSL